MDVYMKERYVDLILSCAPAGHGCYWSYFNIDNLRIRYSGYIIDILKSNYIIKL